jgi:hypothetical protein
MVHGQWSMAVHPGELTMGSDAVAGKLRAKGKWPMDHGRSSRRFYFCDNFLVIILNYHKKIITRESQEGTPRDKDKLQLMSINHEIPAIKMENRFRHSPLSTI